MGLVKFEVDIPNFEKELSINITIRRDGEVFYSTSSPSMVNTNTSSDSTNFPKQPEFSKVVDDLKEDEEVKEKKSRVKKSELKQEEVIPVSKKRGNFMNAEL